MKNHRGRNKSQNRVMKDPHARSAANRDGRVIAIAFESAHDRDPNRSIFFFILAGLDFSSDRIALA